MKKVVKTGLLLFGFVTAMVIGSVSVSNAQCNNNHQNNHQNDDDDDDDNYNNNRNHDKVLVNHRRGNGTFRVISIRSRAVARHLAHGDNLVATEPVVPEVIIPPIGDITNP